MDYRTQYHKLVSKARAECRDKKETYYENHHILPRCLSGGNEPHNLVLLTAREHFVAHHLLLKIYPDSIGVASAFWLMSHVSGLRVTAQCYERTKQALLPLHRKTGNESLERGVGIHAQTLEDRRQFGRDATHRGVGIHAQTRKDRVASGRIGNAVTRANGTGFYAQSLEEKHRVAAMGGRVTRERGTGIHGVPPERRALHNTANGYITVAKKSGIHAQTSEQRSEARRLGREALRAKAATEWAESLQHRGLPLDFHPDRETAESLGLRYFWGKECSHGCGAKRFTSNGKCCVRHD